MAATDAKPLPLKNTALRITFPIFDNDGDLVTGAAGLDSEVSKDGGAFADCTNEATEIAASSGMYYLDLTSTEMDADTVAVIVKTSTVNAKTTPIVLYPKTDGEFTVSLEATGMDSVVMSDLSAVPAATASIKAAINWIFEVCRNKRTQTATTETIFKDDGSTSLATSTKSDAAGTFTRGEYS